MPKITSFSAKPREISSGKYANLAPKILTEDVEVLIDDISAAQSNAIRRVLSNELPTKVLLMDRDELETDDPYIFPDFIIDCIKCIPIMQTAKEGEEFTIKVKNDSAKYIEVTTKDFKPAVPANNNIVILHLDAGRYIKIRAVVTTVMGYRTETMPHVGVLACQCVSVPNDPNLQMYDQYIPTSTVGDPFEADSVRGTRSGVNKTRKYALRFCSLGIMPAKELFRMACANLIERLKKLLAVPIVSAAGQHLMRVDDESATIGPLLIDAALVVDYSCNIVYTALTTMRSVEFRFFEGELDAKDLIKSAVELLVGIYETLMADVK